MRTFAFCCLASLLLQESSVVAQDNASANGGSTTVDLEPETVLVIVDLEAFANGQEANTAMDATPGSQINVGVYSSVTVPDLSQTQTTTQEEVPSNQTIPTTVTTPTTTTITDEVYTSGADANGAGANGPGAMIYAGAFPPEREDTQGAVTTETTTSVEANPDLVPTANPLQETLLFDCPLTCRNEGKCIEGRVGMNGFPFNLGIYEAGPLEYHCECPVGWTGLVCEKPFTSCNDGNHACLHGGQCRPSFLDKDGNEQYSCDCENAVFEGMRYAGKFCQAQAVEVCQDGPDPVYCVNGTCKNHFEITPHEPCRCDSGFEGARCEYASGEAPKCDLDCNEGKCRIGKKQYSEQINMFIPTDEDHQYCVCPRRFNGANCEIEGARCGESHCFNGGTCVQQELPNGTVKDFCDCSGAFTDDVAYAGEYCEAESNAFCTRLPDHNGQSFCVNGGTCKGDSHLGCSCLEGFVGPICEFEDKDLGEYKCDLTCENDGICRKGAKDIQLLQQFGVNREHLNDTHDNNFEHCVCPKGFVGITCEFKMDVCPGANHVCMNGGECIPDRDEFGLHFECDCVAARHPSELYAGEYCEFESTEFCTLDGQKPESGAMNSDAFCVNNSKCHGKVSEDKEHPGCFCVKGFDGDHCEMSNPLAQGYIPDDGLSLALIAVIVIGTFSLCAIIMVVVLTIKKRRHKRKMMSPFSAKTAPPAPTLDHLRALEPWMSPGSLSGSDEDSQRPSSRSPSRTSRKNSTKSNMVQSTVSVKVDESNGKVSLMKDAKEPVSEVFEYQNTYEEESYPGNHVVIDLSEHGGDDDSTHDHVI